MERRDKLLVRFSKLEDKIKNECVQKTTIESMREIKIMYLEYYALYKELKVNYGVDYSNKVSVLSNFIKKYTRLLEKTNKMKTVSNDRLSQILGEFEDTTRNERKR